MPDIVANGGGMPRVRIFFAMGLERFAINVSYVHPLVTLLGRRGRIFKNCAGQKGEQVVLFLSLELDKIKFGPPPLHAVIRFKITKIFLPFRIRASAPAAIFT